MDIERNINIYRKMDIVNYYSNNNLFEPEREILNIIKEKGYLYFVGKDGDVYRNQIKEK